MEKAAYTVREAAELLSISEVQLRRVIKNGDIAVKRIGYGEKSHHIRIPAESIAEFLAEAK
jgi:excisionase family DNA binding protein